MYVINDCVEIMIKYGVMTPTNKIEPSAKLTWRIMLTC